MRPQVPPPQPEEDVVQSESSQQSLQFVFVESDDKNATLGKIRSHITKRNHQKRRDEKKQYLKRAAQQRGITIRPRESTSDSTPTPPSTKTPSPGPLSTKVEYRADLVPYAWFETNAPILYVNRSRWPFPKSFQVTASGRIDDNKSVNPRQSHWMPYTRSPDYVGVKGAVLDLQVLRWIGQTPECFEFRVETIKWIQNQLEDPVRKISNATIGAIMTFSMWTAGSRNSAEMSSHMDAVEIIVNLRGGFKSFISDGRMVARLTSYDSIIAVLTGKPPRFPLVDYFVSRPITTTTIKRMHHHESPLTHTANFGSIISYHKDQDTIIDCLQRMWQLTQDFEISRRSRSLVVTSKKSLDTSIPFVKEPQHPYKTHLLTLPLISSCHNLHHSHVLTTLESTASIYAFTLTSPKVDFPSSSNTPAFNSLCDNFSKCSDDDFWVRYPGVLLWVLLVGTAASRGKEEASFWIFYLARTTGGFSDAEGWMVGSRAVKRFVEVQSWMRGVGAV
ncbi:hypothetical protein B0J14DRAFT_586278 [Halenospora varia]|nr:hypothetical protein B0J14DRAFT_586278 [Halenospora varia]